MKRKERVPFSCKIIATILLLLCLGLLISLIVVVVDYIEYKHKYPRDSQETNACGDGILQEEVNPKSKGLFDDLSPNEIISVRDFMLKQSVLGLKNINEASVSDNYIYMIQLQPPEKDTALKFIDNEGLKPTRQAVVVTFQGAASPWPVVQEYIVGPLNDTEKMAYTENGDAVSYHARPFDRVQRKALEKIVAEATKKAFLVLNESYDGYHYHNCSKRCLKVRPQGPFGKTRNDRSTWLKFTRAIEGDHLHPVDFQLHVDFRDANASKWKIDKVYYNGRVFNKIEELMIEYDRDASLKSFIPAPKGSDILFSSYKRRETLDNSQKPMRPPRMFEPDGKRYSVSGRHVKYMSWSFDFRVDSISGLQIFNVHFNNTRIVYEISQQEAISFHSGFSPFFMSANFVYSGWAMGAKSFEMVNGIDCPVTSKFFDIVHFVDTDSPQTFKNAVCVFEMDIGSPLRRHFESDGTGGYRYYGGLTNHALVLRTISTVHNYDHIYDFIFYQNGAIEVKATPTGYLQAENVRGSTADKYGQKIRQNLLGNLHDHFFHYKVDLDVHGRLNSFETIQIRTEDKLNPWLPQDTVSRKVIVQNLMTLESDMESEKIDFDKPTFYNMFSDTANAFGSKQGYLIQHQRTMKQMLPESNYLTKMAPWSTYPIVITKYKANEAKSSSLYNQNSPIVPIVDFQNFFRGENDRITNEDLVAWVTIGSIQIPSTENVPNIVTTANSASFILQPFNYFDEDPSMVSRSAVVIRPANGESSSSNARVERFGAPDDKVCLPRKYVINFKGTNL